MVSYNPSSTTLRGLYAPNEDEKKREATNTLSRVVPPN